MFLELPILSEVFKFSNVKDVLHLRGTCRALQRHVTKHVSMYPFWWTMVRRVAHRPKYAKDIDGCYHGRTTPIYAMQNYAAVHTIQQTRNVFGECRYHKHLNKFIMKEAEAKGTCAYELYRVWRRYAKARIKKQSKDDEDASRFAKIGL